MTYNNNIIIGTAGHIDHGKTALIKALNGYDGDENPEEKKRGITINLSFSNLSIKDKNIAFIDVPGHEKFIKNMIAGAFGFDYVMLVIAANEGIMPQTIEHIEILNLLDVKRVIVVLTKSDLVKQEQLEEKKREIKEFLEDFDFTISSINTVSIYDQNSIEELKKALFSLEQSSKIEENFFRYYIDRVFSATGLGTVVTGTVLGSKVELDETIFIPHLKKESKIRNIQIHNKDEAVANISNRAALNLQNIKLNKLKRGDIITKKGFLRGFNTLDISFKTLKSKKLHHNRVYTLFVGSKKLDVKVLLFDSQDSLETGFATLKASEELFCIYKEKIILRDSTSTVAGGVILNSINDPMKKTQKKELLLALDKNEIKKAYEILLKAHKKGLGLISSTQRFALSHTQAIQFAQELENSFCDKKELVIYPLSTKEYIKKQIEQIYNKNSYALLSNSSIKLRLKWASSSFIQLVLDELIYENFLIQDGSLYKNANMTKDIKKNLEDILKDRLEDENITPTAPYNIYDELEIDRKFGDEILKSLCAKKQVIRLQHNIFIHANALSKIVFEMKNIIKQDGYIDTNNFKSRFPNLSRKYLIAYLDYLDKFSQIKRVDNKRVWA